MNIVEILILHIFELAYLTNVCLSSLSWSTLEAHMRCLNVHCLWKLHWSNTHCIVDLLYNANAYWMNCVLQYLSKNKLNFHYNELYVTCTAHSIYILIFKSNSNLLCDIFCTPKIYSPEAMIFEYKFILQKRSREKRGK